jgi:2-dehydro-3-deoxyphosphogluconate aldolase/(4S)-4-hydroxy-2-oxoglutarate aldolase
LECATVSSADLSPGEILGAIVASRILPVLSFSDPETAIVVCSALRAEGVRAVEITLRTSEGLGCIRTVAKHTDLVVGAGTVLSATDLTRAVDAGAAFAVSPGLDDEVLGAARATAVLALPGIATPTEAHRALKAGCRHVKVFPAAALGGPHYLRQLHGPFPELTYLPSGGIDATTAADYLDAPGVFAVSGSWMAPAQTIRDRDKDTISRLTIETFERITPRGGGAQLSTS